VFYFVSPVFFFFTVTNIYCILLFVCQSLNNKPVRGRCQQSSLLLVFFSSMCPFGYLFSRLKREFGKLKRGFTFCPGVWVTQHDSTERDSTPKPTFIKSLKLELLRQLKINSGIQLFVVDVLSQINPMIFLGHVSASAVHTSNILSLGLRRRWN